MDQWMSRRSSVYGMRGVCASSQTLASAIGVKILDSGGNAADAAVAMAAALNVTEPCSTGIGGDAFALYYDAATRKVHCLSGNGASAAAFSLEKLRSLGIGHDLGPLDPRSGLCVTVPGAAGLWDDLVKRHGQLPLETVLEPAASLAENGFPIYPVTAEAWSKAFLQGEEAFRVFRPDNAPLQPGQVIRNPDLAETFRLVGRLGAKNGFYAGRIADAIVQAAQEYQGLLTLEDLSQHETSFAEPISTVYKGLRVYQTPPPSHGLAVLLALNILQEYEALHSPTSPAPPSPTAPLPAASSCFNRRNGVENTHLCIEAMRRGFADALHYIGDPAHADVPLDKLLSREYSQLRAREISPLQSTSVLAGTDKDLAASWEESMQAFQAGETVYFCVVDAEGNACSMINSNYMGFGTGIVPRGCGFTLQNRGFNFSLVPTHNNAVGGRKKPYHTIIPGLATYADDGRLYAVFGNMGGFMQPMGHLQLLRGLVDFQLDPQLAIDAPRWYLTRTGQTQSSADMFQSEVQLEGGYQAEGEEDIREALRALGHHVHDAFVNGAARSMFGKAQVILQDHARGISIAGSDPRSDGCAIPLL